MTSSDRAPVVYYPGVGWDEVTGTDKLLATEMCRARRVLWVDPPVPIHRWLREHGWRGLRRRVHTSRPAPTLIRVRAAGPPWPNRALTWRLHAWRATSVARRMVQGIDDAIVVVSTPQPRPGRAGLRIYYATDDFAAGAELTGVSRTRLERWERRQLVDADVRVAISPVLADRWRRQGQEAVVLPNGCDSTLRDRVRAAAPAPEVALRGPVAGVVGQLSARLDLGLLETVAASGLSLLLVGPLDPTIDTERMDALLSRHNVLWVGRQPFERLPSFLRLMDVGLTPYAASTFNAASIPLKTLEYLAAGIPVVSTPLPALDLLPAGLVTAAATPEAFALAAVRSAGTGKTPEFTRRSEAFARTNSWAVRAKTLLTMAEGR